MHVVFDIRRPPIFKKERKGRPSRPHRRRQERERTEPLTHREVLEALPDFQSSEVGPFVIRASRFVCNDCDGSGRNPERDWEPGSCAKCAGRGFTQVPLRRRPFLSGYQWRWGGREWSMPTVFTVWHVDPEADGTDSSCRNRYRKRWRYAEQDHNRLAAGWWMWVMSHYDWWHVHHWRVQFRPAQALRRWMFTRCQECGKRFPYGYAPVSHSWDGLPRKHWWSGEPGLFHGGPSVPEDQPDCSTMASLRASYDAVWGERRELSDFDREFQAEHRYEWMGWLAWWRVGLLGESYELAQINARAHERYDEMSARYPEVVGWEPKREAAAC